MQYSKFDDSQFLVALKNRSDLSVFNENKVAAYALELFFGLDDTIGTVSQAATGGSDDAKTDILLVNREQSCIVIVQAYEAQNFKVSAKGNKGADLSYAIGVLLSSDEDNIPLGIKPHIQDARAALAAGEINMIHVWYVHNLPESKQIQSQMLPLLEPAKDQLKKYSKDGLKIDINIKEVGLETLDSFYRSSNQAIIIDDTFNFETPRKGFIIKNDGWETFVTTINGSWLSKLYNDYTELQLFSANVRGFMGANNKNKDKVINTGIQTSATATPNDFFVFNNGITALVHEINTLQNDENCLLSIRGISIVNGAQTTGSLGSLPGTPDLSSIEIGVRFIKCESKEKIENITRFNNSQNKVISSDFKANDATQRRLRNDFKGLNSAEYNGGLRGMDCKDRKLKIDAHSAAQVLMSWHGSPYDSYHNKMKIWEEDKLYNIAFNPSISAKHIVFIYTLFEAINLLKDELRHKEKIEQSTQNDKDLLSLLNERGSAFLIIHAMSKIIETLIDQPVKSAYGIGFKHDCKRADCIDLWKSLLILLQFQLKTLRPGLNNRLSNGSEINKVCNELSTMFGTTFLAIKQMNQGNPYIDFIKMIDNSM